MQSMANNFGPLSAVVPWFLSGVSLAHRVVGPTPLEWVSSKLNKLSGNLIPAWNPYMPSVSAGSACTHIVHGVLCLVWGQCISSCAASVHAL